MARVNGHSPPKRCLAAQRSNAASGGWARSIHPSARHRSPRRRTSLLSPPTASWAPDGQRWRKCLRAVRTMPSRIVPTRAYARSSGPMSATVPDAHDGSRLEIPLPPVRAPFPSAPFESPVARLLKRVPMSAILSASPRASPIHTPLLTAPPPLPSSPLALVAATRPRGSRSFRTRLRGAPSRTRLRPRRQRSFPRGGGRAL